MFYKVCRLSKLNSSTNLGELSLHSFSLILSYSLFEGLRSAVNNSLSLSKTETGYLANSLNNLNLFSADFLKNNVKLGLFFSCCCAACCRSCYCYCRCCGYAEFLFYCFNELRKLKNGKSFDFFNHSCNFLRCHFIFLRFIISFLKIIPRLRFRLYRRLPAKHVQRLR